jgi:hypothetical protein
LNMVSVSQMFDAVLIDNGLIQFQEEAVIEAETNSQINAFRC